VGGTRVRPGVFMRAWSRYRGFLGFSNFSRCSEDLFAYLAVKRLFVYIVPERDRNKSFSWESIPLVDYSKIDEIKDCCGARVLNFRHEGFVIFINRVPCCVPGCSGRADVVPMGGDYGAKEWEGRITAQGARSHDDLGGFLWSLDDGLWGVLVAYLHCWGHWCDVVSPEGLRQGG
jgi:hypothetical protein